MGRWRRCWPVSPALTLVSVTISALAMVGIGTLAIAGVLPGRGWRSVVACGPE